MTGNEILRTMSHWVKSRARSLKIIWEGAVRSSEKDKCPSQEGAGRGQRTQHCPNLTHLLPFVSASSCNGHRPLQRLHVGWGTGGGGPGQKAYRQRINIEDEEVEGHGEADGAQQPDVHPGRHPDKGLVLRQAASRWPGGVKSERHKKKEC